MDISKNTQIDLLYLRNPNFKFKYNKSNNDSKYTEEIKFYRKRILNDTKEYLRGNKINEDLDNAFFEFANNLIAHYKFIDKKDLIQKEYRDIPKKKKKTNIISNMNADDLIMKTKEMKPKTIKDFLHIVVKEKSKKKIIIPKKKIYNLKDEKYRKKRLN